MKKNQTGRTPARPDELDDAELLRLYATVRAEMRSRRLPDSVGAVGEQLVIDHYRSNAGLPNLQPAPPGTKNVDALARTGERFSIKTICHGVKTGTIYPDTVDPDKQLFEYIVIAKLAPDWSLVSIHQLTWTEFLKVRLWDKRMNAWYLAYSSRTLKVASQVYTREVTGEDAIL